MLVLIVVFAGCAVADSIDCTPGKFQCDNNRCVGTYYYCDQYDHCGDNSDEPETCGPIDCGPNMFKCANYRCVNKGHFNDTDNDCGDWSDEPMHASTTTAVPMTITTIPTSSSDAIYLMVTVILLGCVFLVTCIYPLLIRRRRLMADVGAIQATESIQNGVGGIEPDVESHHTYDEIPVRVHEIQAEPDNAYQLLMASGTEHVYKTIDQPDNYTASGRQVAMSPKRIQTSDEEVATLANNDADVNYCYVKTGDGRQISLPSPTVRVQTSDEEVDTLANNDADVNYCYVKTGDGRQISLPSPTVRVQTSDEEVDTLANNDADVNYCYVKTGDGRQISLPSPTVRLQTSDEEVDTLANNEADVNYCYVKTGDGRHISLPSPSVRMHTSDEEEDQLVQNDADAETRRWEVNSSVTDICTDTNE